MVCQLETIDLPSSTFFFCSLFILIIYCYVAIKCWALQCRSNAECKFSNPLFNHVSFLFFVWLLSIMNIFKFFFFFFTFFECIFFSLGTKSINFDRNYGWFVAWSENWSQHFVKHIKNTDPKIEFCSIYVLVIVCIAFDMDAVIGGNKDSVSCPISTTSL